MSKRGFDFVTDSNGSRMAFEIYFEAFESHPPKGEGAFESLRIRSNPLERTTGATNA